MALRHMRNHARHRVRTVIMATGGMIYAIASRATRAPFQPRKLAHGLFAGWKFNPARIEFGQKFEIERAAVHFADVIHNGICGLALDRQRNGLFHGGQYLW